MRRISVSDEEDRGDFPRWGEKQGVRREQTVVINRSDPLHVAAIQYADRLTYQQKLSLLRLIETMLGVDPER